MQALQRAAYPNEAVRLATDYHTFAEQCVEIAAAASPEARKQLFRMAETWFELSVYVMQFSRGTSLEQYAPSSKELH